MIDKIRDDVMPSVVLTYTLIAHAPLIHFQHGQKGATLRATEVKPKLDAFLKKKITEEKGKSWYIGDTKALNYKLRLVETRRRDTFKIGSKTDYDIFYGNQGPKNNIEKMGVLSDVEMTIICGNSALREMIDRYVGEFFVVTNFGSMSGKGFGSFTVKEKPMTRVQIAKALKEKSGAAHCYAFCGGKAPFKNIKTVYSAMKSGISFGGKVPSILFDYMYNENVMAIDNEKEWLREKGLVPLRPQRAPGHKTYRYVRALLGVGYMAPYRLKGGNLVISMKNAEIERLSSPIFFKVIDGMVYMVANRINEKIYGKKFEFSNDEGRSGELSVPTKDELTDNFIDDFLDYVMWVINDENVLKNVKIEEVL